MHGRKKSTQSEAEIKLQAQKASTYMTLVKMVIDRKQQQDYSPESLVLTSKMIKSNPDFYSLWNFRRSILISMHGESIGLSNAVPDVKISAELGASLRDEELAISADGIRKNPKSYGAWYHRVWILKRFEGDREAELELCKAFLQADQRNFHCWAYRRFVTAETATGVEPAAVVREEFDFSTSKISDNFSNYSSFHHRSVYIQQLGISCSEVIDSELGVIENAIFTEPDDQSAWWYLHFLLQWARREGAGDARWLALVLRKVVDLVRGLLEVEERSKWALTALVNALQYLREVAEGEEFEGLEGLREEYLVTLIDIDPIHTNRYRYLQRTGI